MLKKNNTDWTVGQRWLSETEPELGLGLVSRVEHRHVRIRFDCVNEERLYRKENAPLLRFRLAVGEEAADDGGPAGRVDSLREENGLVYYRASGRELCETDLSVRPVTRGKGLFARLQGGDPLMFRAFRLRLTGLQLRARL
ncbi:MAG: hypothetical protein GY868_11480, partial [Deltaproteobacteria bacterium]|nr:hypothetical protein [Deltaproteobacteria bacterium]